MKKNMIKKLRAYLLEDDDNRSSLSWYVVIIMIAPLIGVFFQYKKEKSTTVATVNGYVLDKNIVRLKLYEQAMLLERFVSVFGRDSLGYLVEALFQGKSPEEFVVQNELTKLYHLYLFEKYFGQATLTESFIFNSLKNKEDAFLVALLGEFVFGLVTGKDQSGNNFRNSLDMNKVDHYCQYAVAGDCAKRAFSLPLTTIYDVINSKAIALPRKIIFDIYECEIKDRKDIEEVKKSISDETLLRVYQKGIKDGLYREDMIVKGKLSIYSLDRKGYPDISDEEFNELVEKKYYALLSEDSDSKMVDDMFGLLDGNFALEYKNKSGEFLIKGNKEISCKGFLLPQVVREYFAREFTKENEKENNKDYSLFISQGKIYYFRYDVIPEIMFKSFEDAKANVLADHTAVAMYELMINESDRMRHIYEDDGKCAVLPFWKHSKRVYDQDSYRKLLEEKSGKLNNQENSKKNNEKKDNAKIDTGFYDLVSSKIESLCMKNKITFIDGDEKKCTIYGVSEIIDSQEADSKIKMHKNSFKDSSVFVDIYMKALFLKAKVDFINNDVSL